MNVFVVMLEEEYEPAVIQGAFSTYEKAVKFADSILLSNYEYITIDKIEIDNSKIYDSTLYYRSKVRRSA